MTQSNHLMVEISGWTSLQATLRRLEESESRMEICARECRHLSSHFLHYSHPTFTTISCRASCLHSLYRQIWMSSSVMMIRATTTTEDCKRRKQTNGNSLKQLGSNLILIFFMLNLSSTILYTFTFYVSNVMLCWLLRKKRAETDWEFSIRNCVRICEKVVSFLQWQWRFFFCRRTVGLGGSKIYW